MLDPLQVEIDVKACLRATVASITSHDITPAQLSTKKPSESPWLFTDAMAYRRCLDLTCACLRAKGYEPPEISRPKARELVGKVFADSVLFLMDSILDKASTHGSRNSHDRNRTLMLVFGMLAGAALVYLLTRRSDP